MDGKSLHVGLIDGDTVGDDDGRLVGLMVVGIGLGDVEG